MTNEIRNVTVIMPVRNEGSFIRQSLTAVLEQDYPKEKMEILVVDGMSEDETRKIVRELMNRSQNVYLIDNPEWIVPTAMNRAIWFAHGEIIIRVDGHCVIPPDYVAKCVEWLQSKDIDCVGGVLETLGVSKVAEAIALAQSSPFGVGGVAFRTNPVTARYVDTVAFGAYKREVFNKIGLFDEELVRNQDDEFNFRLIQAGGKIWLDPSLKVKYYSRSSFRKLWKQYFEYGFYKVRVIQKRRGVPAWRHLVPPIFVLAVLLSLFVGLLLKSPWVASSVLGPYLGVNLIASVHAARHHWSVLPLLPIAFATLHFSYGLGFLLGTLRYFRFFFANSTGPSMSNNSDGMIRGSMNGTAENAKKDSN